MTDRIYVTYTPTTVPGIYHTAIHYKRTGPDGNVVEHFVIEAQPEKIKNLTAPDKAIGVIEEAFRNSNGPSRFGRIDAIMRSSGSTDGPKEPCDDPNAPYEIITEGDDLSENLARMQLFASGLNRAGFAYRGDHQNSNTFAGAALQAGKLPPATGVAHDPAGPPGELLEFFAPGLNEPLSAPIGQHSIYEPALSPVLRELQKYKRSATPDGPTSASTRGAPLATPAHETDSAGTRTVPFLGKSNGNSLIMRTKAASPSKPLLAGLAATNWPNEESAFGDRSENAFGGPRTDIYPWSQSRTVSSAFPGIIPRNPNQPAPWPEAAPPLGIFIGKPMSPWSLPPQVWPDNSDAFANDDWFNFLAGMASRNPTQPSPPPGSSKPTRYLGRRIGGQ
jgi:hypothetical protein